MKNKNNNTYRNITITSIITIIMITSGISVAYAANFSGSNTFGNSNTASGSDTAAFGYNTAATGNQATTIGIGTTAQSAGSFAIGRCNEFSGDNAWTPTDPLFMIGDGDFSFPNCTTRHNLVTVLKNGNVGIGISSPTQPLQVNGIIESTSNGFKFPDGTTQTTANLDNSITNEIETWSTLSGIPAGFSDNTDDNTQLDATAILGFGFEVGPHTVDTNTQLDQTGVTSLGFVTGAHTIDTNTQLTETQVDNFVANNGYSTGSHTIDTTLDQTGIESFGFVTGPHTGIWSQSGSDVSHDIGNVGIGTSNPTSKLHIKGSTTTDAEIFLQPSKWSSEGNYGQIKFGDNNHYIRGEFHNGMTFYDADKFLFAGSDIGITGNVGIGTDKPDRPLTITGLGTSAQWISLQNTEGKTKWHINHFKNGFNIAESGVTDGVIFAEPGGNVGIGTTNPNSKLQVSGYIQLDVSSGIPPSSDCDNIDEYGRMKVNSKPSTSNLYVCTPSGWSTK